MILKLILNDGTELTLADANFLTQFVFLCSDRAAFNEIWEKMTDANLSDVTITGDGAVIQHLANITLDGAQAVLNPSGTITGHFYFHGATTINDAAESEYVEAAKILLGEED